MRSPYPVGPPGGGGAQRRRGHHPILAARPVLHRRPAGGAGGVTPSSDSFGLRSPCFRAACTNGSSEPIRAARAGW